MIDLLCRYSHDGVYNNTAGALDNNKTAYYYNGTISTLAASEVNFKISKK